MFIKNVCDDEYFNFNDDAKEEIFVWETFGRIKFIEILGKEEISKNNGYYWGKCWLDATIKMWKEDLNKTLFIEELNYNSFIMKKLKLS